MIDWSSGKFEEFANDSDKEEERTLEGICKLNSGISVAKMSPKSISYKLRAKKVPGSSLTFTGIVDVPEGQDSGILHTNLTAYFGNDSSGITELRTEENEDGAWKDLIKACKENLLPKDQMIGGCWNKIHKKKKYQLEEVRDLLKKIKERKLELTQKQQVEKRPPKDKGDKKQSQVNDNEKTASSEAKIQGEKPKEEEKVNLMETSGNVLVWQIMDEEGILGRQYVFDDTTQEKIKKILVKNPNLGPANFFIECGIKILPFLHKENAILRTRIDDLKNKLETVESELQEVTLDRNTQVRSAFDRSGLEVKELSVARAEKASAEATAEGLREHIATLEAELRQVKDGVDIKSMAKAIQEIQISTKKTEEEVSKAAVNTNKIVQLIAEGKYRKEKMFTPVGQKVQEMEDDWVLVTQRNFFQTAGRYRSLVKDLDKLARNDKLERMTVVGEGDAMGSDLVKKKGVHGSWDGRLVAVIIDGVEKVKDKDVPSVAKEQLASAGRIMSIAFEDTKPKKVFFIAGPTLDPNTEKARVLILEKLMECVENAASLNMSDLARKSEEETLEKWCEEGKMSPLATAVLLSTLVWWAGKLGEGAAEAGLLTNKLKDLCQLCGFIHEGKDCYQGELADAKVTREDDSSAFKDEDLNRNRSSRCENCNKKHPPPCRYQGKRNYRDFSASSNYRDNSNSSSSKYVKK